MTLLYSVVTDKRCLSLERVLQREFLTRIPSFLEVMVPLVNKPASLQAGYLSITHRSYPASGNEKS